MSSSCNIAMDQASWLKHRQDMSFQQMNHDKQVVQQTVQPSHKVNEVAPVDPSKILDIHV